jgi:hypothetical protein
VRDWGSVGAPDLVEADSGGLDEDGPYGGRLGRHSPVRSRYGPYQVLGRVGVR